MDIMKINSIVHYCWINNHGIVTVNDTKPHSCHNSGNDLLPIKKKITSIIIQSIGFIFSLMNCSGGDPARSVGRIDRV